jgi:hypothetical protein
MEGVQLHESVIKEIVETPGTLLVFGAGNDTPFWAQRSAIILETNMEWLTKIKQRCPHANIIKWDTPGLPASQWNSVSSDHILPKEIQGLKFDVILVDAPLGGYQNPVMETGPLGIPTPTGRSTMQGTGRMGAISAALELSKSTSTIYVDDFERPIEHAWAEKILALRFPNRSLMRHTNGKVTAKYRSIS